MSFIFETTKPNPNMCEMICRWISSVYFFILFFMITLSKVFANFEMQLTHFVAS